jgi:ABC-type Fe3+/spermidine/putrescine transport system ATPase subunit
MTLRVLGQIMTARCPAGVGVGESVMLSIRPEVIDVHTADPRRANVVSGTVNSVEYLGEYVETSVSVADSMVVVRQGPLERPLPGDIVWLEFRSEVCTVLTDNGVATGDESDVNDHDAVESAVV